MKTITNLELIQALGVEVEVVDDLDGDCAIYYNDDHLLKLCSQMCGRKQEKAAARVLGFIAEEYDTQP